MEEAADVFLGFDGAEEEEVAAGVEVEGALEGGFEGGRVLGSGGGDGLVGVGDAVWGEVWEEVEDVVPAGFGDGADVVGDADAGLEEVDVGGFVVEGGVGESEGDDVVDGVEVEGALEADGEGVGPVHDGGGVWDLDGDDAAEGAEVVVGAVEEVWDVEDSVVGGEGVSRDDAAGEGDGLGGESEGVAGHVLPPGHVWVFGSFVRGFGVDLLVELDFALSGAGFGVDGESVEEVDGVAEGVEGLGEGSGVGGDPGASGDGEVVAVDGDAAGEGC